jgi:hypothetical protein
MTGTDPFADANDAFVKAEDLLGRLLLVTPTGKTGQRESTMPGQLGPDGKPKLYDWVETTTVVLDGDETEMLPTVPAVLDGFQYAGKGLTGQLMPKVSTRQPILGRMGRKPSATKGFGPMWILLPPEDADKVLARRYIADNPAPDVFDA